MNNGEIDCGELQPVQETNNPLTLIALAIEKGAGIEAIKELQQMQERWEDRKAEQSFNRDFVLMKGKLPVIVRGKTNGQTKSKYAPLEDINSEVDPILKEFGFGTSTRIESQTLELITVVAELRHKDGHKISTTIQVPVDDKGMQGNANKTKLQGIGSSITYARRYAICALLNISTGDDADGNQPERKGIDLANSKRVLDAAKKEVTKFKTATELDQSAPDLMTHYITQGLSTDDERELFGFINERKAMLKDYNELVNILNEKREKLTPEEIEQVERIIKFGEVKSFKKAITHLKAK